MLVSLKKIPQVTISYRSFLYGNADTNDASRFQIVMYALEALFLRNYHFRETVNIFNLKIDTSFGGKKHF